jgi:hypothetical protein
MDFLLQVDRQILRELIFHNHLVLTQQTVVWWDFHGAGAVEILRLDDLPETPEFVENSYLLVCGSKL